MIQIKARRVKATVVTVLSGMALVMTTAVYKAQVAPKGAARRSLVGTYTWVNGSDLVASSSLPNSTANIFSETFLCIGPPGATCEYQIQGLGLADDHSNSASSFLSILLDGAATTPGKGHIEWVPVTQLQNSGGSYDTVVPFLAIGNVVNNSGNQAHQLDIYLTCRESCETTFRTGHFSLVVHTYKP